MTELTYNEYEEIKEKITKEVESDIVKQIKVQDSYFYGEMIVSKIMNINDPLTESFGIVVKLSLVKSDDFKMTHLTNERRIVTPKQIVVRQTVNLDSISDLDNREVAMGIFYDVVSKELTKNLISEMNKDFMNYSYNSFGSRYSMRDT